MAESVESDESEVSYVEPLHPWGKRLSFRAMLEGGDKKLVLVDPPIGVSDFFRNRVFRSHGCTYDDRSVNFYATSPGMRGEENGTVLALRGNCTGEPVLVASGLDEPAAIAVYQPGVSVCVVTNRGIYVLTRQTDDEGAMTDKYDKRQISRRRYLRGIAVSAGGGIVSFCKGSILMYDGETDEGERERVLAEANYDERINETLFADNRDRQRYRSNCCFMDIVDDKLVMSDLQKHVISLWQVADGAPLRDAAINYVTAIDVSITCDPRQSVRLRGADIPNGKLAYASGIRLDAEGWVMCADADGRTIQIFDDRLQFVTRIETTSRQLPYISGFYVDIGGHLMVCDRKNEMGGLRVFLLEPRDDSGRKQREERAAAAAAAAAARYSQPTAAAATYSQPAAASSTWVRPYSAAAAADPYQSSYSQPAAAPAAQYAYPAAPAADPYQSYSQPAAATAAPYDAYSHPPPYLSTDRYAPTYSPNLPPPALDYYTGNYNYYQR